MSFTWGAARPLFDTSALLNFEICTGFNFELFLDENNDMGYTMLDYELFKMKIGVIYPF